MAVTAAPFWRRLLADLCDLALLGGVGFALWRSGLVRPTLPARAFDWIDYTAELLAEHLHLFKGPAVVMLGVAAIYAVVTRHLLAGTLGERLLGLRLIDREGEGAGPLRALAHAAGTVVGLGALLLGYVWAAVDPRRQGLAEYVSGTLLVVGEPRPD
ncbi:MAG: RDD family protein [Myxococcales bacterium]|nr:RDD family protein [Myxococcales bacterium]